MKAKKLQAGFTLIELLVVITIIGLLSSVVLASLNTARQKARIARAQSDLKQLQLAFEMFLDDRNEYPPFGSDLCSACSNPPNSTWVNVVDELVSGRYMGARLEKDPWDRYFYYDKNNKQPCFNAWSVLCSVGPNGVGETNICQQSSVVGGDDICVFFPDSD